MLSMLDACMLVTLSGDMLSFAIACCYTGGNNKKTVLQLLRKRKYLLVISCKRGLRSVVTRDGGSAKPFAQLQPYSCTLKPQAM